ncbi:MAG: YggS family pyridoxal phosphate-dependent enzyme [Alphaproteobacteria bacterium]|nr:YggS family pyridoxal phosphate-dependent enzyme [Alphaproteobacteria bacterium]
MSISENLEIIHSNIRKACESAGRAFADVTLVAVSKTQPEEKIREALAAGQRVFGENRVQEARAHWAGLRADYHDLELHLIGPLQTNKVRDAVALFDVIQTVDREKLARALAAEMEKQNRPLRCFIQVNTGEEPQKAGVIPADLEAFKEFCVQECGLDIRGLMCIPPAEDPPALHFALLDKFGRELGLPCLSMGMSGDFEQAIGLGATHIRIGTALFGER